MTHYTYTPKKSSVVCFVVFIFYTNFVLPSCSVLFPYVEDVLYCSFLFTQTHTHTLLGLVGNCGVSQVSQVCQSASFHPPLSSQSPLGWLFNYSTCSRTKPCRAFFLYVFYSLIKIYINAAGSMKQAVHMLGLIEPLIRPWLIRVGCGSSLK